jgi:hypothetical protein
MTSKVNEIDWGGIDLVVNQVKLATTPGGSQTTLTTTELGLIDGVTAGEITASKVVTAGSDSMVPLRRHVIADAAAVTLTAADSGALVVFDKADGATITLPTAAAGLYFDFIVHTTGTSSNNKVITASASEFIKGVLKSVDTDTGNAIAIDQAGNGTTHVAITMNRTTTGGITGTHFRLTAISATIWMVDGFNFGSGTVATPFATS